MSSQPPPPLPTQAQAQPQPAPHPAVFAVPSRNGSSTSLGKRSRSRGDGEGNNYSYSVSTKRSCSAASDRDFGSTIGRELYSIYHANACWACNETRERVLDKAHVLPKKDPNFHPLQALGLLGITAGNALENAIRLCKNCHASFDDQYKPGIVIVPSYLDYFLATERRWQATVSPKPGLRSPTTESYFAHCDHMDTTQRASSAIADRTRGGNYTMYVDEGTIGYPPRWQVEAFWHGDPMAMVYRAIQSVERIVMPDQLPRYIKGKLMELHMLYEQGNKLLDAWFEAIDGEQSTPAVQSVDGYFPGQFQGQSSGSAPNPPQLGPSQYLSLDVFPNQHSTHTALPHDVNPSHPLTPAATPSPSRRQKRKRHTEDPYKDEEVRKRSRGVCDLEPEPEPGHQPTEAVLARLPTKKPGQVLIDYVTSLPNLMSATDLADLEHGYNDPPSSEASLHRLSTPMEGDWHLEWDADAKWRRCWRFGPESCAKEVMEQCKVLYPRQIEDS